VDVGLFQQEGLQDLGAQTDSVDGYDAEPRQNFRCCPGFADIDPAFHDPVDHYDRGDQLITAASRDEWRAWLEKHHATETEVWLVYYKKHTGKPSVSYIQSVKEAICFGWIDGLKKRVDDERYMHRFTPRKPGSKWSPTNITLAKELIGSGRMTEAGLTAFRNRKTYDDDFLQAKQQLALLPEYEQALKQNEKAWARFTKLAPSYRKNYIGWLQAAKKPETRHKRLQELIKVLEENKKLGMK
jgi:uncharacterized protein YdeI (YjbR/CyaY-like superfamily)